MASREIVPERVFEHDDPNGKFWEVKDPRNSLVEVWADTDAIVIRQDNGFDVVDLIELSHGQAYDLLSVISRALNIPVR